jgi:hypothetical protein
MFAQPAHDVLTVEFMKIRRSDMKSFWIALVAVFMVSSVGLTDAQAKRVGGGGSVGKQAPSGTMQRNTTPSTPAGQNPTPATPAAPAAAQNAAPARPAAPPPAAQPQRNRWLGPIAGLAAGLGLAALASHLGFGGELASMVGSMLMIGLMVMAGSAVSAAKSNACALLKLSFCLAIIWSSAGSRAPRLLRVIAPVMVSSVGPAVGPGAVPVLRLAKAGAAPATTAAPRKWRLSMRECAVVESSPS